MISLLFNLGVYTGAMLVYGMAHRRFLSVRSSTTYQRLRWRRLAAERGLESTGAPDELTGTWRDVPVVLDLRGLTGRKPTLLLRVQGLHDPGDQVHAPHTRLSRLECSLSLEGGDLELRVPFRAAGPRIEDLETWLDAVREADRTSQPGYR